MLSLGSRDDGRKGLGLGLGLGFRRGEGAMEENELEEGEACSGQEDDACIDPDIALSYIDEKLQDVLGHFQKDFEGGVSAENLGAKFGGYGSFLPSYQRSPSILAQPKSPPKPSISKSPYNNPLFENARQNPSIPASAPISKNNAALSVLPIEDGGKKEMVTTSGCVAQHDSSNKTVNSTDQKSLKVRIKVGHDNSLATNNAAIYSGLGLDSSPSSSPEDSPGGSTGLFPEFRDVPGESPITILQVMTSFAIPGDYLISPLHENLLHFIEKESSVLKNNKTNGLHKGVPVMGVITGSSLPMKEIKGLRDKKTKSDEKNGRSIEEDNSSCKVDKAKPFERDTDIETTVGQMHVPNALDMSFHSSARGSDAKVGRENVNDLAKGTGRMPDPVKESNKISVKDRIPLPYLPADDQFDSAESMRSSDVGHSVNKTILSEGKQNPKTGLMDKALEERSTSSHKDTSSDVSRADKRKTQENYDTVKLNFDGHKSRNGYVVGHAESVKQMPPLKAISHGKDEKMLQGSDQQYKVKRKQKGSQNSAPSVDSTKENLRASSVVSKEKKKSSHARGGQLENKSKLSKSRKEMNGGHSRESNREVANVNAERVENRVDLLEPLTFSESSKERPGFKKDSNLQITEPLANASMVNPAMGTAQTSDAAAALHVINDNWVCCDICQKWRLLPYETDPNNLPKKWKCSMQTWLRPGLNSCSISEEETQKAFNALYLVPAPETTANLNGHHDVAATGITSTNVLHSDQRLEHNMQSALTNGKKKHGIVDASNLTNHYALKKNIQASSKSRSLNDANEYPEDTNSLMKAGLGIPSKSTDFTAEKHLHKQKEKHKIPGHYTDGGDVIGKSGKHSKSKSKREADEDVYGASKKIKKESSHRAAEDLPSDLDMAAKVAPNNDGELPTKVNGKILQNYSDYSSSKDSKCELKGKLSASNKRLKDPVQAYSSGEAKEHYTASDAKKSSTLDVAAKKRKVKEWQESQGQKETLVSSQHELDYGLSSKEAFSESELRKQKKAKVSKSEGKESTVSYTDGKFDKKGRLTRILLSGSRQHPSERVDEGGRASDGKEQMGNYQGNATSQRSLDGMNSLKRDMAYAQLPTATTSSSSKVSGSRRSKANFQEARGGSPVESVSSSPLRISNSEKLFSKRNSMAKDDVINAGPPFTGSPKRCSDGEVDGGSDQSGTRRKETASSVQIRSLESHRVAVSGVLGSSRRQCDYLDKEANQLSGGKFKDELFLNRGTQDDLSPDEFEETNMVDDTGNLLDHHNKFLSEQQEKDNIHNRDKSINRHCLNGSSQRKSGKSSSLSFKERNRSSTSDVDRVKLKVGDSLSDQKELYSARNVGNGNCRSEPDINCQDGSIYHENLRDGNYNLQEKCEKDFVGKKDSAVKWSHLDRRDNRSNNEIEENSDAQRKDFNSKVTLTGSYKSSLQENLQHAFSHPSGNPVNDLPSDRIGRSDMALGRVSQSTQSSKDKHEAQSWDHQTVPTPVKGSRSELCPVDTVNGDALKMVKQSRKPDSQNGVHPFSLRQATPNGHEISSPMRKDGPSVANVVLKEARDLKHTANRLKSEGLEHESIGLYFEAALKFLHGASLLEPPNAESAKLGELNPSIQMMQMYSDTAKLCEYCAHEYERCKEMAAAALAYKCVEVAYMKVAFYKHPAASKDRNELQTALQTALPGESPSSSASDVDNLNHHGALDKAASAKAVGSPQIAGNHVIAARNRPHFVRLLSYTNDLNCAFEATKRSQNAIAAASVSLGKNGVDGMPSVRKVLDFNYHNVEGLLRLVRLSMASINH